MKCLMIFGIGTVIAGLVMIGCGDPINRRELNRYKDQNRYIDKQELVTQTAFLTLEVNGKLRYDFRGDLADGGYASGFLISRNRGLFKTAYHFSQHLGENGVDWCRLFINGRVYRAGLHRALSNRDSAVIKILDKFNEIDFPEPPPMAIEKAKVGDSVSIEGYHPHPYYVRLRDQESGKKFQLIPLLKNYYQTVKIDREDYTEIVYEVLKGDVTDVDKPLVIKDHDQREISVNIHTFFTVKMREDHLFSFGGLSGTVVKNERGEVVGEVTAEQNKHEEENRIIFITPIESEVGEIKDLLDSNKR